MRRRFFPSSLSLAVLVILASIFGGAAAGPTEVRAFDGRLNGVKTGIDVLLEHPGRLQGRKVGLITNPTGVTRDLVHDVDALLARGVALAAVFGPEHGVRGTEQAGERPGSFRDPKTGLPFVNLYGKTSKEIAPLFADLDVVLFDVQDVGTRFYTYLSTLAYAMQAAALAGKPIVVLDRPNPIGGEKVEGPVLDPAFSSFVGVCPLPIRHGMTIGELALLFNDHYVPKAAGKRADLTVIPMEGWHRRMWFDQTGLPWVMPSPNMPTPDTALVYPGNGLLEGTNLSEGRGTTRPFELIGAPYIKGWELAERLNALHLPGVRFREAYVTPAFSKYAGRTIGGLQVHVTDREAYEPVRTALAVLAEVKRLYPSAFRWRSDHWIDRLAGTDRIRKGLDEGRTADEIAAAWEPDLRAFLRLRSAYLLYR